MNILRPTAITDKTIIDEIPIKSSFGMELSIPLIPFLFFDIGINTSVKRVNTIKPIRISANATRIVTNIFKNVFITIIFFFNDV